MTTEELTTRLLEIANDWDTSVSDENTILEGVKRLQSHATQLELARDELFAAQAELAKLRPVVEAAKEAVMYLGDEWYIHDLQAAVAAYEKGGA